VKYTKIKIIIIPRLLKEFQAIWI